MPFVVFFTLAYNVWRYGAWLIVLACIFWPLRILYGE